MLGSMSTSSTSILGMRWRTVPLAAITSFKAESSHPLSSLEHFSSTMRSLEHVSLIPWRVTPSYPGTTRFLRSFRMSALLIPSMGFISTASGRARLGLPHELLEKYTFRPCKPPHAGVRAQYSRR